MLSRVTPRRPPTALLVAGALLAGILVAGGECAAGRKFYSRPLKFRYVHEDQETSATKHEDKAAEYGEGEQIDDLDEHHEDQREETDDESYESDLDDERIEKKLASEEARKRDVDEGTAHGAQERDQVQHLGERHSGREAEKSDQYDEDSKHQKGHSTKGEHSVLKKDEYEKKQDFHDEFLDDGAHDRGGERQGDRGSLSKGSDRESADGSQVSHKEKVGSGKESSSHSDASEQHSEEGTRHRQHHRHSGSQATAARLLSLHGPGKT